MRSAILLGLGLFVLASTSARADRLERDGRAKYQSDRLERYGRHYRGRSYTVRGKKGRKYLRRFSLRENLTGDKLRIYDEHGYTPHRLGFNAAGRRTERWRYHSLGLEYLFDEESNLIATRHFPPVGNHID
ncbi:MAG: hypothetical protein ACE5EO_03840 [Candidatus Krumholzibacteriia bacterium]